MLRFFFSFALITVNWTKTVPFQNKSSLGLLHTCLDPVSMFRYYFHEVPHLSSGHTTLLLPVRATIPRPYICSIVRRTCAIYQYSCAKNGRGLRIGTKEAHTIKINNRRGGHFERLNILEIFQDSYCAYRDLTIKSKLFKSMFMLSCLLTI